MKKSILALLLIAVLCISAGCGNNTVNGPTTQAGQNTTTTTPTQGNAEDKLLPDVLQVYKENIFVDVPLYRCFAHGYYRLFVDGTTKLIGFSCFYTEDAGDLAQTHARTFERFTRATENYHKVNSLGEITERTVTINGIEAYNYEGIAKCGWVGETDAYIYGYAFNLEGHPCSIIGVVSHDEQPESAKQQVKLIVDEMMKSVRNTL